jgi:hypothetical protein
MSDPATLDLPTAKHAYSFDETTRELLSTVEVFLSPLEGTYYLPRNVVEVAPPSDVGAHARARLNSDGTTWDVVPDFRRVMLWETATCRPVPNTLALGDALPDGVTAEAPPILSSDAPLMNVWDSDARAWRQQPDYSRTPVWSKATAERAANPRPGEPLPDALTVIAPPLAGTHQAPRWNAQRVTWDIVPDDRVATDETADDTQHVVAEPGVEPPVDMLTAPPVADDALTPIPSEA